MGNIPEEVLLALAAKNSGGGSGGTSNYEDLENKPKINGVTLSGNKSASDLGLASDDTVQGILDGQGIDSFSDVETALAGKQDTLTAGDHINIDDGEIAVNRYAIPAGDIVYEVLTGDYNSGNTIYVDKYKSDGTLIERVTVNPSVYQAQEVDEKIRFYKEHNRWEISLLVACKEQSAGYNYTVQPHSAVTKNDFTFTVEQQLDNNDLVTRGDVKGVTGVLSDLTTTAKTNLVAAVNELNTGLLGKQDTLTFDSVPTDGSTNPVESNGVYDALATKQDATDNNLQTTAKTVVGGINELNSNLTSLEDWTDADTKTVTGNPITITDAAAVNAEALSMSIEPIQNLHGYDKPWVGGAGKNKLPMTVDGIKALNTTGTWSGNVYTINGGTFEILTDSDENVIGVKANGTFSTETAFQIIDPVNFPAGSYKYGCASSSLSNDNRIRYNDGSFFAVANSVVTKTYENDFTLYQAQAVVSEGTVSNIVFQPMVYLASETDATFAPYTNICPISGHTEGSAQTEGKNLFDYSTCENKSIDDSGNTASDSTRLLSGYISTANAANIITIPSGITLVGFVYYDGTKTFVSRNIVNKTGTFGFTATQPYVKLYLSKTDGSDAISKNDVVGMQFERGSVATGYAPYVSPHTATITFGTTVYGGTVDFNSGVMTVDRASAEFDGSSDEQWSEYIGTNYHQYNLTISDSVDKWYMSNLLQIITVDEREVKSGIAKKTSNFDNLLRVCFLDTEYSITSLADFKTWLASNPLQVVYELATPTELTLTPAQLELLKGNNTITANGATISLTYQPDNLVGEVMEQVDEKIAVVDDRIADIGAYTRNDITDRLENLVSAVAEQNLEKYGYRIGDYFTASGFTEASGYTYILADMDTFYGGYNDNAVVNTHHITLVVKTNANSKWAQSNDTSAGYKESTLHSYLENTVLEKIKTDMIHFFGGTTGLEHLVPHHLLWTKAITGEEWEWSDTTKYISALTEEQIYGVSLWGLDKFQAGEGWKWLEVFQKYNFPLLFGNVYAWLRNISSATSACAAYPTGIGVDISTSNSRGVVGLIMFK